MNILKITSSLLLLLLTLSTSAFTLSPKAKISVLTCSPGNELYSLFGHSAIRIQDSEKQLDFVFNYGTFDFNTPHFYIKYAQGLLPYQLSISSYEDFIGGYIYEERSVYSQELNLDADSKQKLAELLLENYHPQNRTYLYNFLYDNCSTRIRDIIEKSTPAPIQWNLQNQNKSFWNLLDEYLVRLPWVKWGIHTILGQSGSRKAQPYQYMFLPDYLMKGLESATLNGEKLAALPQTLFVATPSIPKNPWYKTPAFIFTLSTLLIIFILQYFKSKKLFNTIAFILFLTAACIGFLLVFLSFFTQHPITAPNLNLFWANPLHVCILYFLLKKKIPSWVNLYLSIYAGILFIGICIWFFAVPAVPAASFPLLVLFIYLSIKIKRTKYQTLR